MCCSGPKLVGGKALRPSVGEFTPCAHVFGDLCALAICWAKIELSQVFKPRDTVPHREPSDYLT